MRTLFLLLLVQSPLNGELKLSFLGATQTQALVAIRGASGPCALALSESPTYSPPVPDLDGLKYAGAGTDTSRSDTVTWSDGTRIVTLGHQINDRALGVLTPYYLQVSGCGGSANLTFTTSNLTTGTTQGWPPPFDSGQWAKRGWPFSAPDLLTKNKHIDPLTGVALYPASGALDWTARYPGQGFAPATLPFLYWSGGSGWTNPSAFLNGPTTTASTTTTNPIHVYLDPAVYGPTNDGPYLQWSISDMASRLFGSATDATSGNRQFTLCIELNPTSACVGNSLTITAPQNSGGAALDIPSVSTDPDHPWPSAFPQAFYAGWGGSLLVKKEDLPTTGTLSATAGVLIADQPLTQKNHFSTALEAGNKIFVSGTAPTCTNNLCTVASVQSAVQVSVAESVTVSAGTPYTALRAGLRIAKTTATGTLTIGAKYKLAGSINMNNAASAQNLVPNSKPIVSGDGKTCYLSRVPSTHAGADYMMAFCTDGTSRMVYGGRRPPDSYFIAQGFADGDIPGTLSINWAVMYPSASDGRTWYLYQNSKANGPVFYRMHYDGDLTEDRDWHYMMDPGGDNYVQYPPSDKWTWSLAMPTSLDSQIRSLYPSYKSSIYGSYFAFAGLSGDTAYFKNNYNNAQNYPAWIAVVDMLSGVGVLTNLIHTMDGTGTNGVMRFGGNHSAAPTLTFPDNLVVGNWPVGKGGALASTNLASGGSGYAVGDTGIIGGPNGGSGGGTYVVNSVSGGAVTGYTVTGNGIDHFPTLGHPAGTARGGGQPGSGTGFTVNILSVTSTMLHGGPFQMPITAVKKLGVWSSDTSLPWPPDSSYDNDCGSLAPGNPYISAGATGNQCFAFTVPAGGWCSLAPSSTEKATWPCPSPSTSIAGWNTASYAQPFPIRVGDVFGDFTMGGVLGDNEEFRVVRVQSGAGPGGTDIIVAQRNAMPEYCCVADLARFPNRTCVDGASQNRHGNGWVPMTNPASLNGCFAGVFSLTGKTEASLRTGELGRSYLQGHGEMAAGTKPGYATYASSSGATPQAPISSLLTPPVHINVLVPPTFHGVSLPVGGGAIQSYTQIPGGVPWFTDSNTLNNNGGGGREGLAPIAGRTLTSTATPNVYKIQVLGVVDYKVHPLIGWAGRYLLGDISGPSSNIAAAPFTLCHALKAGECYAGALAGDTYVNVPAAYDPGSCVVSQHWANVPCVISGWPGAGGFRQQDWTAKDTNSSASRFLTYLFDIPGGQYAYSTFTPLDGSIAWGPPTFEAGWGQVTFLVKLPPWQQTQTPRNDLIKTQETLIQIPPGPAYAELQFGYSRWVRAAGSPAAFQCMPRAEACNTSGQPYNFEGQARTLTSCTTGCRIHIPVMAPNIVYYRVRRSSDGINWINDGDILANAIP